nr:U-actitoxin-Avd3q-like [Pocillopora verrucosa]
MLVYVLFCSLVATTAVSGSGNHCSLPMEIGFCKAAMPRFYYNSLTGECEKFTYGGCGGNKNNFLTKESCLKECKKEEVNDCCLPSDTGPCFALFNRFYYDKVTKRCKKFIYGGCAGNGNNFTSKRKCKKTCRDVLC